MATQTDIKVPPKTSTLSEETKKEEAQNPVVAPTLDPERTPPDPGSWQAAFVTMADELESMGWGWLGNIFRDVGDPPTVPSAPTATKAESHATKAGK